MKRQYWFWMRREAALKEEEVWLLSLTKDWLEVKRRGVKECVQGL